MTSTRRGKNRTKAYSADLEIELMDLAQRIELGGGIEGHPCVYRASLHVAMTDDSLTGVTAVKTLS